LEHDVKRRDREYANKRCENHTAKGTARLRWPPRAAEYPYPLLVLNFDDEDAVFGRQDVILPMQENSE
jgi:hypothetical protein